MLRVLKRYSFHLVLAILIGMAYSNSFRVGFVLDNASIIFENPALRAWNFDNLQLILSTNYWAPKFSTDLYRPVTTLSYAFNYSLLGNGESPVGYHVINMMLHWINCLAVFALIKRMIDSSLASAVATAVFAVHPLATEAVTNIVGRADLLVTLFVLMGLHMHLSFRHSHGIRRAGILVGIGFVASLAVFSKENGVLLVGLMILADLMLARSERKASNWEALRDNLREGGWQPYIPVVAVLILMMVVRRNVLHELPNFGQISTDNPLVMADFWTARLTSIRVIGDYCLLFAWPVKLSCDYSFNQIPLFNWTLTSSSNLPTWLALALIGVLLGMMIRAWFRRDASFFFLAFFFGALAPIANLFFMTGTIMGERLMYLPMIGLLGALAVAIATVERWIARRLPSRQSLPFVLIGGLASIVILALGVRTFLRNRDWQSDLTLWQAALVTSPNSIKVYRALSATMFLEGTDKWPLDEVIRIADRGIEIVEAHQLAAVHRPIPTFLHGGHYYRLKSEHHLISGLTNEADLANQRAIHLLSAAAESDKALNEVILQSAIRKGEQPESIVDVGKPQIYQELGMAFLEGQQNEKALETFQYLQRLALQDPDTHCCMAAALGQLGRLDEAAVCLMKMLMVGGGDQQNWNMLVQVYQQISADRPAITQRGSSWTLAGDNPLVRQHLDRASSELIQELLDNHQPNVARQVRDLAVGKFGCSATTLDELFK